MPTFPQESDELPSASKLAKVCRGAEEAGASAVWATDHLFWHRPLIECFAAIGVAAAATTHATIGSCIVQLPLRNPAEVAKQASSLQHLSGGRLVLGVGVGSHPGEYEAAEVEYQGRGRRLDRAIDELHRIWGTQPPALTVATGKNPRTPDAGGNSTGPGIQAAGPGVGSALDRYRQLPSPTPTIPIWVGGSSEVALRRAAHHAEGWIPLFLTPDSYREAQSRLDTEAARVGREPGSITRAMTAFISIDDDKDVALERGTNWMSSLYSIPAKAFAQHLVAGTAKEVASRLSLWLEAGATHLAVYPTTDNPLVQFEALADELDSIW